MSIKGFTGRSSFENISGSSNSLSLLVFSEYESGIDSGCFTEIGISLC